MAGCFWARYGGRARVHAEVMSGMARKAVDLVATGRFAAENLPELTYPLERASAFAREARARAGAGPPPSLRALDALVESYRRFVDAVDRMRRERPASAAAAALAGPLADVEAAARALDAALAADAR